MENFPFGQPVKKVEQFDKSPKKVFILGVYASAVHAKWISAEGKTLVNALAVASEPYIFWKGDCTELILNRIKLPMGAGKLIPAEEKFNGPSGKVLDEEYLAPLGLSRDDCWLCDLVPYSMLNPGQEKVLRRNELLFEKFKLKKHSMRSADKVNRIIGDTRWNEIVSEIKKSKAKYLITLGNEPLINLVKGYDPDIKPLNLKQEYGSIRNIVIDGYPMKLIALVHPRQAGKLGGYSQDWNDIHSEWKRSTALKIRKLLET